MPNFKIFDIDFLLVNFPKSQYFIDVLNTHNMEVGIINLKKNQKDTQQAHDLDEIYYVIRGTGSLDINGFENDICPGKVIYIPKKSPHNFKSFSDELVVIYILA